MTDETMKVLHELLEGARSDRDTIWGEGNGISLVLKGAIAGLEHMISSAEDTGPYGREAEDGPS